jgi:hypothetical protein
MTFQEKLEAREYESKLPFALFKKDPKVHDAYRADSNRLHQQFKNDLFEEYGVVDNPKRELLYQKAWNLGHAYGYESVATEFGELVELIR